MSMLVICPRCGTEALLAGSSHLELCPSCDEVVVFEEPYQDDLEVLVDAWG